MKMSSGNHMKNRSNRRLSHSGWNCYCVDSIYCHLSKWIDRRQMSSNAKKVFPSISLMADADVHGTPPDLHNCCRSSQQKQTGCQFPSGNSAMLTVMGREVLGGQGGKTALRASHCPPAGCTVGERCCFCSPRS